MSGDVGKLTADPGTSVYWETDTEMQEADSSSPRRKEPEVVKKREPEPEPEPEPMELTEEDREKKAQKEKEQGNAAYKKRLQTQRDTRKQQVQERGIKIWKVEGPRRDRHIQSFRKCGDQIQKPDEVAALKISSVEDHDTAHKSGDAENASNEKETIGPRGRKLRQATGNSKQSKVDSSGKK